MSSLKKDLVSNKHLVQSAIDLVSVQLNKASKDLSPEEVEKLKNAWGLVHKYVELGMAVSIQNKVEQFQKKVDQVKENLKKS